ncbi:CLUMA_CG003710, isoform A [Clunio marinus]|uniref:CLUMA_CG003710, isoform A n=1 Tax=Clunio marinus TaxID=568069 RepID=A0A1J1HPL0_9DIPT|nr:CLUMA_CG003710, isoform A [Clunio marinus]
MTSETLSEIHDDHKLGILLDLIHEYLEHSIWRKETLQTEANFVQSKYRLNMVTQLVNHIKDLHREVKLIVKDPNLYKEDFDKFSSTYIQVVSAWQHEIETGFQLNSSSTSQQPSHQGGMEIPMISIPDFDDSYSKLIEYRNTSESLVHNSKKLSNLEKFQHSSIKLPSNMPNVLANFTSSEESYEPTWQSVKNGFDNTHQLKSASFDASFTFKKMNTDNATKLRRVIDHHSISNTSRENLKSSSDDTSRTFSSETSSTFESNSLICPIRQSSHKIFACQKFISSTPLEGYQLANNAKCCINCLSTNHHTFSASRSNSLICSIRQSSHKIFAWQKFSSSTPSERYQLANNAKCCIICLSTNHQRDERPCITCEKHHHKYLHFESSNFAENSSTESYSRSTADCSCERFVHSSSPQLKVGEIQQTMTDIIAHANQTKVLLSTAIFFIKDSQSSWHLVLVLLDSGSDAHFITSRLARNLQLQLVNKSLTVADIKNETVLVHHGVETLIQSRDKNFPMSIQCFVLHNITHVLPSISFNIHAISFDKILGDPNFDVPLLIGMLVGSDVFYESLQHIQFRLPQGPILTQTLFAWILVGTSHTSLPELSEELCEIWKDFAGRISFLNTIKTSRHIVISNAEHQKIHGFCDNPITSWSDSIITLYWITTTHSKLTTFAGIRVSSIQQFISSYTWKHIRSEENPADVISRVLQPEEIEHCAFWWNAPTFFNSSSSSSWSESILAINKDDPQVKVESRKAFTVMKTTYLFHLIIIKIIQETLFDREYKYFLTISGYSDSKVEFPKNSKIKSLSPHFDKQQQVIKVVDRIEQSPGLTHEQKHQFVLPEYKFTKILIQHISIFSFEPDNEFRKIYNRLQSSIGKRLEIKFIKWHFTSSSSPHSGGFYDIQAKSAKHHSKFTLEDSSFDFKQFSIHLFKIEDINFRSLIPLSNDSKDFNVLTPIHFLTGRLLVAKLDRNYLDIRANRLDFWIRTQQLQPKFRLNW